MTLLFPLLASLVLLSRPVLSKLNDSALELLFAHERCFPADAGCFASDVSLVVFLCFCSVAEVLEGEEPSETSAPGQVGTCLCLHSSRELGQ